MSNSTTNTPRRARWAGAAGLLAAGAIGGGILAGTFSASAATTPSPAPSSGTSTAPGGAVDGFGGRHAGSAGRSDEKVVTGTTAATLRAAALKAVPGGTVDRVETDAGDGSYEAHMTKADGTRVTVKFDSKLAVLRVESGMGTGDPALTGQSAPDAPAAGTSSSSTGSTA